MVFTLVTDRLVIRRWTLADAEDAVATYGVAEVTGWLTPATGRIAGTDAMRAVLAARAEAQVNAVPPRGRWAIQHRHHDTVVGGLVIGLLPPYDEDDLEISFQLRPGPRAWPHAQQASEATDRVRDSSAGLTSVPDPRPPATAIGDPAQPGLPVRM